MSTKNMYWADSEINDRYLNYMIKVNGRTFILGGFSSKPHHNLKYLFAYIIGKNFLISKCSYFKTHEKAKAWVEKQAEFYILKNL